MTSYNQVPTALGIANDFYWVFEDATELQAGNWMIKVAVEACDPLRVSFRLEV